MRAGRKQGLYCPRTEETLDSGKLELGEDFQDAQCLLISEVKLFECAQLGNLCCTEYDEIKSLVPSIGDKISDDDLDLLQK
ncbi:hypothetical protein LPJ60_005828 [Coemansia sp. RSA 2675]|nr:hypothetical protein LPJ60_005828 [Coemansia sp. RSA 2675]KAJ2701469.1 hypothetical protein H4218_001436 [Coemansia sp. IMI 209128]